MFDNDGKSVLAHEPTSARTAETTEVAFQEYSKRLDSARHRRSNQEKRERRVGYLQLGIAALAVIWVVWSLRHWSRSSLLFLIPIIIFIVMAIYQERLIRSIRRCSRVEDFYSRGLARLSHQWMGNGETGERFLDAAHPYARDLDLFGRASLFELLSIARTRAGEEILAQWLLGPAPIDEVLRRQTAARELRDRLQFREALFTVGEDFGTGVHPKQLAEWGESTSLLRSPFVSIAGPILVAAWIVSVIAWAGFGRIDLFILASLVNLALSHRYYVPISRAERAVDDAAHDLDLLSGVLKAFESESFTSPKLIELQAGLRRRGLPPSAAIDKLDRLVNFLEAAHNPIVKALDPLIFWRLQFILAIDRWRQRFGPALREWIAAVGELEALLSIAGYAYEHPNDVFPEFLEPDSESREPCFRAQEFAHPLIPPEKAVRNDLELGSNLALIVLSGPNMAGKSTFLRGIGVNVVLAQCGAPVRANRLQLSRLAVTASICVLDSLEGGVSRFYAEIRRLKQIVDLTEGPMPVLFLLDELLSGTNSRDRLIGTLSIVTKLVEQGAIGLVTTHDLALTHVPEAIGSRATNCHFEDQIQNGELHFDYKLRPGIVQTSNALALMRSIGLEI
ncbi:MAG TPA: mismatch repair protein [Acidobacteriaceae bacterium]